MEAARVAAERGHRVSLLEATPQLGGQLLLAARAGWRRDMISVVDWRISELEHLGVQVHYNNYADGDDVLAFDPDVRARFRSGCRHRRHGWTAEFR